ncbi:MAG: acetolactate synthase small subunit [Desulfocapsaceae bacterium]|nr:acetolactate synthase small subunit [Desulfocapsaceae bacterium]
MSKDREAGKTERGRMAVLELTVNNHPGVMSHICGLFSRRAYNLEKILCLPDEAGRQSRMWLQVDEQEKLEQVVKQLQKLEDVRKVSAYPGGDALFSGIKRLLAL